MANRWLFKEEPKHYSFADLTRDRKTIWEGVKNPLAQMHLRAVKKGDLIYYYHTGNEKAVVGIARAASPPHWDLKVKDRKTVAVEIEPVKALAHPVTLAQIKSRPEFSQFPLIRISRLSVMPVSASEWRAIEKLAK